MEPMEQQTQSESTLTETPSHESSASPGVSPKRSERRRKPRTWETPPAPVPPPKLDDYKAIVGVANVDELKYLAHELKGKTLKMVNSTAVGGGVAEMLNQLVPLLNEFDRSSPDIVLYLKTAEPSRNRANGFQASLRPAGEK